MEKINHSYKENLRPVKVYLDDIEKIIELLKNPSCDLPKEVDATSEHKESDLDFKAFGSDGVNRFW